MVISVEISMYPLVEDYKTPIYSFIDTLKKTQGVKIISNQMSTQIFGEHSIILPMLTDEIINVLNDFKVSFIIKILN